MERVFQAAAPNALVVPFLIRGTTDRAYLRAEGMAVYGVPIFRKDGDLPMHGNHSQIRRQEAEVNWAINEGKRHNHSSRASSNALGIGTIMSNSLKTTYGECQSL
jgi:hypothetical protein